jgi:hypothetical protein
MNQTQEEKKKSADELKKLVEMGIEVGDFGGNGKAKTRARQPQAKKVSTKAPKVQKTAKKRHKNGGEKETPVGSNSKKGDTVTKEKKKMAAKKAAIKRQTTPRTSNGTTKRTAAAAAKPSYVTIEDDSRSMTEQVKQNAPSIVATALATVAGFFGLQKWQDRNAAE